jgi:phosphoesterase PA-phosphatase related
VSPWYGIGGYVIAAGTGALRAWNNKHWVWDVVFGAGLGML